MIVDRMSAEKKSDEIFEHIILGHFDVDSMLIGASRAVVPHLL